MSPAGDDRPPKRSGGSERGKQDKPRKPGGGSGQSGDPGGGKKPEYTFYGRTGKSGQKRSAPQPRKSPERREKPPYRVYRSRPRLRDRFRKPGIDSIRRSS